MGVEWVEGGMSKDMHCCVAFTQGTDLKTESGVDK